MSEDFYALKRKHDAIKKMHEETFKQNSKRRLMKIVEKKCQTIMIGAIAQIEESLGSELWGDKDQSVDGKYWFEKFQALRNKILNNGNTQIRAIMDELSNHTVTWERYQTQFIVKKGE